LLALAATANATPLDDYVSKPDSNYKWHDTGARVTPLLSTATAHILNVTSQQWLDTSRAVGPNGAIWMHQVAVVVPKHITQTKVAMAVKTGG
jgi:PhoPQ-activated pathogenicity-related protein